MRNCDEWFLRKKNFRNYYLQRYHPSTSFLRLRFSPCKTLSLSASLLPKQCSESLSLKRLWTLLKRKRKRGRDCKSSSCQAAASGSRSGHDRQFDDLPSSSNCLMAAAFDESISRVTHTSLLRGPDTHRRRRKKGEERRRKQKSRKSGSENKRRIAVYFHFLFSGFGFSQVASIETVAWFLS